MAADRQADWPHRAGWRALHHYAKLFCARQCGESPDLTALNSPLEGPPVPRVNVTV